jgi:cyclohexa-1,5-dienecarbonyl-CoA hydratase
MPDLVTVTKLDEGTIWRVTFGCAKGNILDREMMSALRGVFQESRRASTLKAICIEGAGRHFSFGASVTEHLPGQVEGMLSEIRHLVFDLLGTHVVTMAAVRGQCLGGGLELASVCHRVFASHDAMLGQPEIALGAFAPIASIVLPERIGRSHGEDLCLTGRSVTAAEARAMGLVDELTPDDPADAAIAWAREHFSSRSASSLRLAVRAVREGLSQRLRLELPVLEAIYLHELMATADAVEGLRAFIDKRPPAWRHA